MLMPWNWPENHLLVSIRNRVSTYTYLVHAGTAQAEVFEYYLNILNGEQARNKVPTQIEVTPLDQETYDLLESLFDQRMKIGD